MYLTEGCRNKTTLRTSLQKVLNNNKLLLQLRALGIIGKLITGPWMHQLYTITNLESIAYIKTCLQNLIQLRETPLIALQSKNDTFGVPLYPESDPVLQELLNATTSDLEMLELHEILVLLIGGIIDVIQRQLYDYFEGRLAHLTPSIEGQTLSAPVHNMLLSTLLDWQTTLSGKQRT